MLYGGSGIVMFKMGRMKLIMGESGWWHATPLECRRRDQAEAGGIASVVRRVRGCLDNVADGELHRSDVDLSAGASDVIRAR